MCTINTTKTLDQKSPDCTVKSTRVTLLTPVILLYSGYFLTSAKLMQINMILRR